MTKTEFLAVIKTATDQVSEIEEQVSIIRQNLGYCTESPRMAALGKEDAINAAKVLFMKSQELLLLTLLKVENYDPEHDLSSPTTSV